MQDPETNDLGIKAHVVNGIEQAKKLTKQFDFEEVRSGDWFMKLLQQVVKAYEKNARAEYFQQKYPGLTPDEIADKLISVSARYAAITGAVAGVTVSASQLALLGSAGMTAALFATSIGAEMLYVARLQICLVLDLAVVYDLQLDPDDPEDILMVFGYALGVTPTEIIGKGVQVATGAVTKNTIRAYISKGTLKAIQDFARQLGFKILQREIIKYAVPAVSAAVGSGYNYTTTLSVGKIAKSHLKNRGKVTEELRWLISRQQTYDLIYPAAAVYIAQIDGEFSEREHALYEAMLSRMGFESHQESEFQHLLRHDENLLGAISKIDDRIAAETLLELLMMMAVYDGWIEDEELSFLIKVGQALGIEIDKAALEERSRQYRIAPTRDRRQKLGEDAAQALTTTRRNASHFLQTSAGTMNNRFKKLLRKTNDSPESSPSSAK